MEASLFGDDLPQEDPLHACIECANFAGRARDRLGTLFRMRKGYCLDDRWHPGGTWAVIQDIVKHHVCRCFKPADPDLIQQRQRALEILK